MKDDSLPGDSKPISDESLANLEEIFAQSVHDREPIFRSEWRRLLARLRSAEQEIALVRRWNGRWGRFAARLMSQRDTAQAKLREVEREARKYRRQADDYFIALCLIKNHGCNDHKVLRAIAAGWLADPSGGKDSSGESTEKK